MKAPAVEPMKTPMVKAPAPGKDASMQAPAEVSLKNIPVCDKYVKYVCASYNFV